jgi:GNAT superfamily N-acetyltransferase
MEQSLMNSTPNINLKIVRISSKRELKTFIMLPFRIHKNHKKWVPPLISDEWKFFDVKKNPTFQRNDTILYLAYLDNRPAGRIMGIINRQRNSRLNERNAYFGYLECSDDQDVARVLLQQIENWAVEMGMDQVIGPMGFNDQDQKGFVIEGFEYEPSTQTIYNFEYMPALVENSGYSKETDYVVYQIDLKKSIPEVYKKIVDRLYARGTFYLPDFTKKRELKPWIKPALQLMNETFAELFGYDPLTDEEMLILSRKFLPVIDPRFVKIAVMNNTLEAFILGIPNLNDGLRKARGKLFPFGWFYLMKAFRQAKQFDLLIAGVRPEYRGAGLDVYGMLRVIEEAIRAGFTVLDSHHEHEDNLRVRHVMEKWGGKVCKRFRVYRKELRV